MARTGPAIARRKDGYQLRAASARSATSRPALLTCPRPPRCAPCGRDRRLVRGASAIRRDRLTTEERLSDIVEISAHGLLWLDAFSVDLCSHIGSCAALAHVASWHLAAQNDVRSHVSFRERSRPGRSFMSNTRPRAASHNVLCWWPQSLHLYSTRVSPDSAMTRLAAPHLLHFTSSRVLPFVTANFRASASFTRRSLSSRICAFVMAGCCGFFNVAPIGSREVAV